MAQLRGCGARCDATGADANWLIDLSGRKSTFGQLPIASYLFLKGPMHFCVVIFMWLWGRSLEDVGFFQVELQAKQHSINTELKFLEQKAAEVCGGFGLLGCGWVTRGSLKVVWFLFFQS